MVTAVTERRGFGTSVMGRDQGSVRLPMTIIRYQLAGLKPRSLIADPCFALLEEFRHIRCNRSPTGRIRQLQQFHHGAQHALVLIHHA